MPSRVSILRRRRAFDEGRRSVTDNNATNPYDNATLKALWETGRAKQKSGELTTPIPALPHAARRAERAAKAATRKFSGPRPLTPRTPQPGNRDASFGKYRKPDGNHRRYR